MTNSSAARAEERRADADQSIARTSSPGWYGREPATSEPLPRRALCIPPKDKPTSRRRGTSGKTSVACISYELRSPSTSTLAPDRTLWPKVPPRVRLQEACPSRVRILEMSTRYEWALFLHLVG